jgi:hypothetical protein
MISGEQRNRRRRSLAASLMMAAAIAVPAHAAGVSREAREKAEVRAIFAMLLARMEPGDGMGRDLPCVFPIEWDEFARDKGYTARTIRLQPSLSPKQALDPGGRHPLWFCDYAVRNAQAKQMAKNLSGDRTRIVTADMHFSYPIFSRNFTRAILQHTGGNDVYFADGRSDFVSSWRYVYLTKTRGRWSARFETLGIAN